MKTYRDVMVAACDADKAMQAIGPLLFGLAKASNSVDTFKAGCQEAETWIRTDEAARNKWVGENLPRCWTQAKSDITAGMNAGLNPSESKTLFAFKAAKVAHNKAKKGMKDPDRPDKTNDSDLQPEKQGTKVADLPMIPDDLRPMIKYLKVLPELSRAILVKDITKQAKIAHDNHLAGIKEGQRRGKQKATG